MGGGERASVRALRLNDKSVVISLTKRQLNYCPKSQISIQFTHNLRTIFNITYNLHTIYIQFTHSLHTVYTQFSTLQ